MQLSTLSVTQQSSSTDELNFLDQFYTSHRTEFLRWAYKHYSLSPEESIDIYQDAVIVLFENYQKGKLQDLRSTVKTYFYGIAKNLIFAFLKSKSKQKAWMEPFSESNVEAENIPYTDAHSDWLEDTIEVITDNVKRLSVKGQNILYLYYYEKKSLREITQLLGYSSEDVVKTTKMRYKNLLRQMVQDELNRQHAA